MTWTQTIADSLGVADEGLRLILGQLSGTFEKVHKSKSRLAFFHMFIACQAQSMSERRSNERYGER